MKTKVQDKSTHLVAVLQDHFGKNMNLARIKLFGMFISALCKVQTVCFDKLAMAFEGGSKSESSLRRIQRFMADYKLNTDLIAQLIFKLLPHKLPYRLALDRTNWKFGESNINILTLAIVYQGVAFPILYTMMPKFGNSNTEERIALLDRYIRLFGIETIDCLLADREFIGEHWLEYLNGYEIKYHIRIRENFHVKDPRSGKTLKASWLFSDVRIGTSKFLHRIFYVNNQLCYLSASKIKNKGGVPELQIIVSFNNPDNAQEIYKERWQIETAFRALKSNGFNIEDTHLTDIDRIDKLFALVIVAFTWAYIVGIYAHQYVKQIITKKHGRKAKSLFKYGLGIIANILLNPKSTHDIDIFKFLSCT
ncbi:IS4 family transposase [Bacteroidia bacterium]|nr:IS4 family transposase [Bacteroidia bacterium]